MPEIRSGGYSRKEVQLTLSLSLSSELTYSESGKSEYSVPEQLIRISSINSEYVSLELRTCTTTIKSHHKWSADTPRHHGNRKKKSSSYFTTMELEVLVQAYSDYEHIFRRKSNTAVAAKERETARKKIAARVNA